MTAPEAGSDHGVAEPSPYDARMRPGSSTREAPPIDTKPAEGYKFEQVARPRVTVVGSV